MKKIIALALALIMALSMASVAFAAATLPATDVFNVVDDGVKYDYKTTGLAHDAKAFPGETYEVLGAGMGIDLANYKLTKADFTTKELQGASLIDSVKITKEKDAVRIELKESYTMAEEINKAVAGVITLTHKTDKVADANGKMVPATKTLYVSFEVNNNPLTIDGGRKAAEAETITNAKNTVTVVETAGFVTFTDGELTCTAKVAKDQKVYLNTKDALKDVDADEYDALVAAFGEDFDGIVEMYTFETKAFDSADFRYDAWEDDPHFFYAWDGEKLTQIEAKYDDDEDVDDYVFTAAAAGTIVVCDEEVVLAAEEEATKNPDTGANDVVGVAAALAVVSLVAAGAVSLKK